MNRAALHTVGPNFFASGGDQPPREGQRREFFRIFPRSRAATTIAAGFVVKPASPAPKFASVPVRRTPARAFRTFMRPLRMRTNALIAPDERLRRRLHGTKWRVSSADGVAKGGKRQGFLPSINCNPKCCRS